MATVAGGFVKTHRQAAAMRSDQVNLHDDGRGPGQALVDAEQHVREDDPIPGGTPDEQRGHRESDQPARDQHGLAAVAIRHGSGEEVGDGLGGAEGHDVGQHRRIGRQLEDTLGEQRQHGTLLAQHAAD
jgi:hypothetical protein